MRTGLPRLALWCVIVFWAAIQLPAFAPAGARQHDRNLADFEFVVSRVSENYAGWETKTAGPRRAELDALTGRLRQQVAGGDDRALQAALSEWIGWFDDGHLQVQWASSSSAPAWRSAPRRLTEAAAVRHLIGLGERKEPVEGLWTIDDRYRLAVLRRGRSADRFEAIVLSTSAEGWRAGDVKAILTRRSDGRFDIRYGSGDRTELTLQGRLVARGDVLDLGELGIWRRVIDDPAAALSAERRWPGDAFALTRIGPDTFYLRLPSFHDSHTETVRALLARHRTELAGTPFLIIDVRGNGGGSDFVYDPVLPYLYTRPIWRVGVEIRVSQDNTRLRAEAAERLAPNAPEAALVLRSESARMQTATTPFVRREPPVSIVRLAGTLPYPVRVAILIDRAGSSAENFIMDARQSSKVILMGQENSAGVIDFGEMMGLAAPSGRFTLLWATTRSLRLPGDPVDPDGIAPDIRIPADSQDPVDYAARWLRRM